MDFTEIITGLEFAAGAVVGALMAVAAIKVLPGIARWGYSQVIVWFSPSVGSYESGVIYTAPSGTQYTRPEVDELISNYQAYPHDSYDDEDMAVIKKYRVSK